MAGGPFYCAEGSISNATGRCMTHSSTIPVATLVSTTKSWASSVNSTSHSRACTARCTGKTQAAWLQ